MNYLFVVELSLVKPIFPFLITHYAFDFFFFPLLVLKEQVGTVVGNTNTEEALDERIIKLVQDRPPLYNSKLPISQRSQAKKGSLWLEIHNLLGGRMSVEDLQKRWRYLRDRYTKAKRKMLEYKPSGSGATTRTDPGFNYYDLLKFLDDGIIYSQ